MPFLIAAAASLSLTPLVIAGARKLGLVDRPGALKVHGRPVPLGGAAVAAGAIGAVLVSDAAGKVWLGIAIVVAFATGVLDDRRTIRPSGRLFLQGAAVGAVLAAGAEIAPLGPLGPVSGALVVLATINAVNMVDGQDGLASGLVVIAGVGLAVVAGGGAGAIAPLAAAGAASGFLPWNLPPARAFLGDGGAYVLGLLLAVGAIEVSSGGWSEVLAAGACLGIFAYELVSTVLRRLGRRMPALAGDRDHAYDRLAAAVGSRAGSTYVMWIAGGIAALIGSVVLALPTAVGAIVVATATAIAAAIHLRLRPVIPEVPR